MPLRVGVGVFTLFCFVGGSALAPVVAAPPVTGAELVIGLIQGVPDAQVKALHIRAGAIETDRIDALGLRVVRVKNAPRARVEYLSSEQVRFVEVNQTRHALVNDPLVPQQYSIAVTGLPAAWELSLGDASRIAIVDTGIDLQHEDLAAKVTGQFNAINPALTADDDHFRSHGTHVAGIAAAITNNGRGIAGVAQSNPVLAVKVLDFRGDGNDADIVEGVAWAVDNGARVINLSLGGASSSQTLEYGIQYALDRDVVVVAAAGNSGDGVSCPHLPVGYPAGYAGVIAVSSTNSADNLSCFSNGGPEVSVAAPGENILSTLLNNNYGFLSGTSMSSPFVAGLAALVRSREPEMSRTDVKRIIEEMAYDLGPTLRDDQFGAGRVHAYQALAAARSLFSDVPRGIPFSSYINFFGATGVVSGYGDGHFGPFDSLTRAAAAKIAVGAFGLPLYGGVEQTFSDTPTTHPLYRFVETLARARIVSGVGGGRFAPDEAVTRGALAKIAANTAAATRGWSSDTSNGPHFADVPSTHFLYGFVETLYNHGVFRGTSPQTEEPSTGLVIQQGVFAVDDLALRAASVKIFFSASHQP
ncbi:MAG: S8 family serine peptidase [Actinomycetota bacterium]